jgi:hypothetical protein
MTFRLCLILSRCGLFYSHAIENCLSRVTLQIYRTKTKKQRQDDNKRRQR